MCKARPALTLPRLTNKLLVTKNYSRSTALLNADFVDAALFLALFRPHNVHPSHHLQHAYQAATNRRVASCLAEMAKTRWFGLWS